MNTTQFNIKAIREEHAELKAADPFTQDGADTDRQNLLESVIESVRPILRLCDKVRGLTQGRLMVSLYSPVDDPLTISHASLYVGTVGASALDVAGDMLESVLKAMVLSIEMTNGVKFQEKVAA